MLILKRRIGECIIIGDGEIKVYVSAIDGNKVKIGIEADPSIPVHREEVWNEIVEGRKQE